MSFTATLLASAILGVASFVGIFVRVGSRRRRWRRTPAPPRPRPDDSSGPSLTARVSSLRYPGPIGPRTCVQITNVGASPVHDVIVVVAEPDGPEPTDPALVLWSQASQAVTASVSLGTIWPHEPAVIPALVPLDAHSCGLIVNCRQGTTSWEFELDVAVRAR